MDLRLFFDKLEEDAIVKYKSLQGFGQSVDFFSGELPDINEMDIAFFTIEKVLDTKKDLERSDSYALLRKSFYALQAFNKPLKIADLGCLRPGSQIEDTRGRLAEVCNFLMKKEVLPIILGYDHELDMGQFLGYQEFDKLVSVIAVDAQVDMGLGEEEEKGHTQEMILHHPNYLFDYCHLGYQRYLVNKKVLDTFLKLNFEMKSIGQMRDNHQEIEPLLRAADMLSFDLTAIKHADMPLKKGGGPFGLTGEEACQICWYAGINEKLTSVGFYGLSEANADNLLANQVISTMLWYFIEGFAHRKVEYSFKSNFHIKYIVPLIDSNKNLPTHELIFYKSKQTDKWWMEIPTSSDKTTILERNAIVPCSYSDFETANKGIIPDRWLNVFGKYM